MAVRVDALAEGKDFRRYPAPIGDEEPSEEAWANAEALGSTLNPFEAAGLMAHAAGMIQAGRNSFERLATLEEFELDDLTAETMKDRNSPAKEIMDTLLQESGINDERTMRRRLAQVRRARAKPTP